MAVVSVKEIQRVSVTTQLPSIEAHYFFVFNLNSCLCIFTFLCCLFAVRSDKNLILLSTDPSPNKQGHTNRQVSALPLAN